MFTDSYISVGLFWLCMKMWVRYIRTYYYSVMSVYRRWCSLVLWPRALALKIPTMILYYSVCTNLLNFSMLQRKITMYDYIVLICFCSEINVHLMSLVNQTSETLWFLKWKLEFCFFKSWFSPSFFNYLSYYGGCI